MSLTVQQDPIHEHAVLCNGDTHDLMKMWERHNFGGNEDGAFEVFGFTVAAIANDADHGSHQALRLVLEDSLGSRSVGRLIIQHRTDFREEQPEWRIYFVDKATASKVLEEYNAPKQVGPIADFEADVHFESNEDIDRQLAMWAADYRCNFSLVKLHGPGGGNPVIQVQGLTGNAREWLAQVMDVTDEVEQNELYIAG